MTPITLDDLVTPLTLDEARESLYAVLVQLGVPTTGWSVGAVVRCIVAMTAIVLVALSRIIVAVAKGGFRETGTGNWQTLHAWDTYGIERIAATFATGTVTLENVGGSVYTPAAGDVVIQYDATKKTYRNAASFSLGSGTPGSPTYATFDVVAVEAGTGSNANANVSMSLVTTMSGVTVYANTVIVGTDEELDAPLRAREDESLDALSPNGPAGAYLSMAKTAVRSDGSNVGVTRAIVSDPSSVGEVTVTVASATGAISDTGSPSDLDLVDDRIQGVTGPGCVPAGITATVASAVAHPIGATETLYVYTTDGRTKAELEDAAEALVTAWIQARPISGDNGGKVYQASLLAIGMSVSAFCYRGTISAPASDETISAGEVPTAGTIIITVNLVSP